MSLTEPRRAPYRSAIGVSGQTKPFAAKTAHSVSAIPRAPAVRRVGRARNPSMSTVRIDVAINDERDRVDGLDRGEGDSLTHGASVAGTGPDGMGHSGRNR